MTLYKVELKKVPNKDEEIGKLLSSPQNFVTPEKALKPIQSMNTTKPESQAQSLEGNSNTRIKIQKITKIHETIASNPTAVKEDPKKSLIRKRSIFEQTPMYVPRKKVKKNEKFYQSELKVYDKFRNEYLKFRIFKDTDLGNSKSVQKTLRASTLDDDCPTDSEQLQLAKEYVKKQLLDAHKKNNEVKADSAHHPESNETTDDSDVEDSEFTSGCCLSGSVVSHSEDSKSLMKRLDFDL